MAVMYTFCRYFSVRLGTLLVAASSLIQSLVFTAIFLLWLHDIEETSEKFEDWISVNKLIYATELFQSIQYNITLYLKSALVFLMVHIGTCALLIYAAFKNSIPLTWPFLTVELLRLMILFFAHVTAMMLIKENILDLGLLIALSLSGGFLLLGLYYSWFCVVSLCQCIEEMKVESRNQHKRDKRIDLGLLASDFKHLTKQPPQMSPSWSLLAVHSLHSRDLHYNNIAPPSN